jgi:hypothetical protein
MFEVLMKTLFHKPIFGNILGWSLRLLYRATLRHPTMVYIMENYITVTIYEVTSFPMMKTIMGQAAGQYMFIRSDIKEDTSEWKRIFLHEMKHVEQQYKHGWFGIWFFIKYYYQFAVYTIANMGIVSLALIQMPLEKEAYATEDQVTSPVTPSPPASA